MTSYKFKLSLWCQFSCIFDVLLNLLEVTYEHADARRPGRLDVRTVFNLQYFQLF